MIGIDLFAGAGGMSLGSISAGIDVRIAVDNDRHATATYAHNHPSVRVISTDIQRFHPKRSEFGKDQTIVFGGPPCKGFSTSNQRTRTKANPNNWLYREFLRIVRTLVPDWVVFENVKGILETEAGVFYESIVESLERYGYTLSQGVLNAMNFGVPQNRSRLFIIGSLHGIGVNLPDSTASKPITVKEAVGDLPELPNGASACPLRYRPTSPSAYARLMRRDLKECCNHIVTRNADYIIERYRYVPQGGNWESIPHRLMLNYTDRSRCHTGLYHRLHPAEPAKVIGNFRKNMLIHSSEHRGLSVREAARLQSFPDWFEFKGSIGFQQEQVGNAVPPLLAQHVFSAILRVAK